MNLLTALVAPFVALGAMIGGLFVDKPQLGASEAIPVTIAFFETTLQDAVSSSATSFTLTSATDKDGTTLASSTYAFVIDEGSANEEIVIADCTATACTNALRGVSARTGNTEVTALKKAHRRGASIKITDAPILMLATRALRGESIVNFTPDEARDLVTKTYVDSLALGTTTVAATTLDDGIVELATGVEAASSTATGNSGSPLTLHTGISTSTAPSSGSYVVVTGSNGNIAEGFIDNFSSSTPVKVGDTPLFSIGKHIWASTTAGTSTWTVPTGIKHIKVTVIGGGGGGGSCSDLGTNVGGGGGGGGGTAIKLYDVSATTSVQVVVGTGGGAATNGNPSKFADVIASGGVGGTTNGDAGGGGSATGGDVNMTGGGGGGGGTSSNGGNAGSGGSSFMGGGGAGVVAGVNANGTSGGVYGGGAGGAYCESGTGTGGTGGAGIVLIEY